jgi:hypothetical protein
MKKYKYVLSIPVILLLFVFKGCILDAFDTLTQNIPISKEFSVQGTTPATKTENFCLSSSEIIQDYRDKIEDIQLVTATYQTVSVNPSNAQGDVTIMLKKQDGTLLYSYTLSKISPANYINSPLVLEFTDNQLTLINSYLGTLKAETCFQASVTVDNVTPGGTITLNGKIDIAFKMKAKT